MLDTNIVSDLARNPGSAATRRIRDVGEAAVRTSIIVAAELRYDAAKKSSSRLTSQLEAVLSVLEVDAFDTPADATYGRRRARLEAEGRTIGANDLLIAAQALASGDVLVTDNEREFSRIDELACENWLRPG